MLISDNSDSKVLKFLDRGILFSIFLFAFASLISKAGTSIGMGLACLLWLIRIVITKNYKFTKSRLNKPILFFVSGILISGIDVLGFIFLDSIAKIILSILFYFTLINTIDRLKDIKTIIYLTTISMLISIGYGIFQLVYLNQNKVGWGSSFEISFAMVLIYTITYLFFKDTRWYIKITLLLISIIQMINLLYSNSRSSWLAFLGGSFSLFWIKNKRWLVGFSLLIILLSLILPVRFINDFKSIFDLTDNRSNTSRLKQWKASLLMYKDNVINGVGMGYFKKEFKDNYSFLKPDNRKHAHNNFFHFLATTGTIGFLSFTWLIWSILSYLYGSYYKIKNKSWQLFILASLVALIGFNIQGLTDFSFGDTEIVRFFWYLIAVNVVIIHNFMKRGGKINED